MANIKKIAILAGIPLAFAGWLAFRPELVFVNEKVSEAAPISSTSAVQAEGTFTSYAHETKGSASILKADDGLYLRLSDFTTSNGPDVHVYLVKGMDASGEGVNKNGYLDLGVIKGNIGDQNYKLPADLNLSEYGAVAIWCKRFSVNFGGAPLKMVAPKMSFSKGGWQLATYESITVTRGNVKSKSGFAGQFAIVEDGGKRWLQARAFRSPKGAATRVILVKAETLKSANDVKNATKVDLGAPAGSSFRFEVSKELDLWLYRSISLWSPAKGKSLGTVDLRSEQEIKRGSQLL